MATQNGTTLPSGSNATSESVASKGKGKETSAEEPTENVTMDEDDDDDDDEDDDDAEESAEADDEDGLEEIDPSNIITSGRRTRGRVIDFAKAAAENPQDPDEDEDDDDFQAPDEDTKMSED